MVSGPVTFTYFDSSALVKAYLQEPGTERVRSVLAQEDSRAWVSSLALPETISALARAEAAARIHTLDAHRLMQRVEQDFTGAVLPYQILDPTRAVVSRAAALARRHRLRGFDAVHLATALELRDAARERIAVQLAATDTRLVTAAQAEALPLLEW